MDFAPRLSAAPATGPCGSPGNSSPGTNLAGTPASPNQFKAAAWTGAGWGATETAGQNGVGVLFWDVAAVDGNRVWMVADVDVDGNLATPNDREIYVYTAHRRRVGCAVAADQRRRDRLRPPARADRHAASPLLAWRHGDSVLGLIGDPASTPPQTWFDDAAGVGPMLGAGRLLAGADGACGRCSGPTATAQGQDVWLSRFDPATQAWSQPAPLFASAEQRRALVGRAPAGRRHRARPGRHARGQSDRHVRRRRHGAGAGRGRCRPAAGGAHPGRARSRSVGG